MTKIHTIGKSFVYAFSGLKEAVRKEPNLKIHLILTVFTVFLAFVLKFNPLEWSILVLTISMVFILELINTTLETLVDIVSPQIQEKARVAKDVSAAGVLLAAITSVIVGLLLFLPKVFPLIK